MAVATDTTRNASHLPGRSGEVRTSTSRMTMAGTKPCTKWPTLS